MPWALGRKGAFLSRGVDSAFQGVGDLLSFQEGTFPWRLANAHDCRVTSEPCYIVHQIRDDESCITEGSHTSDGRLWKDQGGELPSQRRERAFRSSESVERGPNGMGSQDHASDSSGI